MIENPLNTRVHIKTGSGNDIDKKMLNTGMEVATK